MTRRAGFTLIEVLVSIVLTAVVSLLVYGLVQAARDTQARISSEQNSLQASFATRLLLESALAGAQTTLLAPDTVIVLENREDSRGTPGDRLTFTTSGDIPPLSPGADWTVVLEPTRAGLSLKASPRGVRGPARLLVLIPGITGLSIGVRDAEIGGGWSEEWPLTSVLPEAVRLTYWTDSGPIGLPLTVSPALGRLN